MKYHRFLLFYFFCHVLPLSLISCELAKTRAMLDLNIYFNRPPKIQKFTTTKRLHIGLNMSIDRSRSSLELDTPIFLHQISSINRSRSGMQARQWRYVTLSTKETTNGVQRFMKHWIALKIIDLIDLNVSYIQFSAQTFWDSDGDTSDGDTRRKYHKLDGNFTSQTLHKPDQISSDKGAWHQ